MIAAYKENLKSYRVEKAIETLNAARLLIDNEFFASAVNRMYYACFYAVIALFLKDNISVKSHNGVRMMLGKHYILTNQLSEEMGEVFNDLFENRQTGDYDDIFIFDKLKVEQLFESAQLFLKTIIGKINE